jgi:glycosyltransferase involved in cell wall biosynthesis
MVEPSRPLVSAIIPVYNGERFLAEAVESILRQPHRVLEIIVVDDGSTDATPEIAARLDPPVRCVRQPNSGPPAARNHGLRQVRGEFVGFLDVDDLWAPDKLEIQLPRLTGVPGADVVVGRTQAMRPVPSPSGGPPSWEVWEEPWTAPQLGCALFRRSVFDRVGPFDETQRYCDDMDWFLRAAEAGISIVRHEEIGIYYRRHENNLTNQRAVDLRFIAAAVKKSLDRRRAGGDTAPPIPSWAGKRQP